MANEPTDDARIAEIRQRVENHTVGQTDAEYLLLAYYRLQAEYDALMARMAVFQARDIEKAALIRSLQKLVDAAGLTSPMPAE